MPKVREFNIILPSSRQTAPALKAFELEVLKIAGGLTGSAQGGAWLNEKNQVEAEHVIRYTIAADAAQEALIIKLAVVLAKFLKQKALYTRRSTGDVEIIDLQVEDSYGQATRH